MEITQEKLEELKSFLQSLYNEDEMGWLEGARQALMIILPKEVFDSIDPIP